jgi:hypothetical protein
MAGWLDKLEKHGKQARKRKSDVAPAALVPVVQEIIVSVRPANERTGDPGEAAISWYFVQDGMLTMCDENGKPLGDKETAAVTAENARAVAVQMTRRRWSESRASDFDGPLTYGPLYGVV